MLTFLKVNRFSFCFKLVILTLLFSQSGALAQGNEFVTRFGSNLILNNQPFYAIGVNCYYLQNLSAYKDTFHIEEVFQEAKQIGANVIRTWGFFDNSDSTNPAVIQYLPNRFNESGLQALDLVISKAKKYSIYLVIPLVNNWEAYGGMNQYVRWYANNFPKKNIASEKVVQKIIKGEEGRIYHHIVEGSYTHDDFYSNPTIIQWYKNYISNLLERVNTFTNIKYKDEPNILAWEVANEPRSSDRSGKTVTNWMKEISAFIKTIDQNHLISTGEEGLDVSSTQYSDAHKYNDQSWLFDGSGGISFQQNLQIQDIDVGSIHCYPESWHLSNSQGIKWLQDHNRIANQLQKPLIIGEVGKIQQREKFFHVILNEALYSKTGGVLIWQLVYDGRPNNDGFALYYPGDSLIWKTFQYYSDKFEKKSGQVLEIPSNCNLLPSYPNPFNTTTIIPYNLMTTAYVKLSIFNTAGQCIANLIEDEQQAGYHLALFDGCMFGSGTYFVYLITNLGTESSKIVLLK